MYSIPTPDPKWSLLCMDGILTKVKTTTTKTLQQCQNIFGYIVSPSFSLICLFAKMMRHFCIYLYSTLCKCLLVSIFASLSQDKSTTLYNVGFQLKTFQARPSSYFIFYLQNKLYGLFDSYFFSFSIYFKEHKWTVLENLLNSNQQLDRMAVKAVSLYFTSRVIPDCN